MFRATACKVSLAMLLLASLHQVTPATADTCLRFDSDPSDGIDGPDISVSAEGEVPSEGEIYAGGLGIASKILGSGHVEERVVRSVNISEDLGLSNQVEWGWERSDNGSSVTFFKGILVDGTFASENVVHKPYAVYEMELRPFYFGPFSTEWKMYIDGAYWASYQHGFDEGFFLALNERFNTCDVNAGRCKELRVRKPGTGDVIYWPEMAVRLDWDPGYHCHKINDSKFVTKDTNPEVLEQCYPDLDPL